jgi:hypothetical protein
MKIRIVERIPTVALVLGAAFAVGSCTNPNVARRTGYIGNYTVLRPGADDPNTLVRVDTSFDITDHNRIILNPVTVWRSDRHRVGDLPASDVRWLNNTFRSALARELEKNGFQLVTTPSETTMVLSAAVTESEPTNWIHRDPADPKYDGSHPASGMSQDTLVFLSKASFETEVADTLTGVRIAHTTSPHGMASYSGAGTGNSTGDVEAAANNWAAWYARRLRAWRNASHRLYREN